MRAYANFFIAPCAAETYIAAMSDIIKEHLVSAEQRGMRLDACLAFIFPELGLRARRRLWDWCVIKVNGRTRPSGFILSAGDLINVAHSGAEGARGGEGAVFLPDFSSCRIVAASERHLAVYKPQGLASAAISGSPRESLDAFVVSAWPDLWRTFRPNGPLPPPPVSCNRLDAATSGLVVYAFGQGGQVEFRRLEQAGKVKKTYSAVVLGRLDQAFTAKEILEMANRGKTLARPEAASDPLRFTEISPVRAHIFPAGVWNGECTLAKAVIWRGARHQIRAHLAFAGFPIAGDFLYGNKAEAGVFERMYLHNEAVEMPGFYAECPSGW